MHSSAISKIIFFVICLIIRFLYTITSFFIRLTPCQPSIMADQSIGLAATILDEKIHLVLVVVHRVFSNLQTYEHVPAPINPIDLILLGPIYKV